ncbi:TonB-dependent receptor [Parabacteroides faecis]|uniref:TonB-dependent receptor n=1 Tax=Parabacteroides faecis TaxID=1217282 RepID=UPI0035210EDF
MNYNTFKMKWMIKKIKILFFVNLFLTISLNLDAASVSNYAQIKQFTFHFEKKTIQDVFNYIEQNSEFVFLFYEKVLDTNRKVNVSVKDESIESVLNKLLKDTSVTYDIKDRQVVLKKKEEKSLPVPASTPQQQKSVTGKVVDETGEPLPGVAIVVEGSPRGVTTDIDGTFSIDVKSSDKLIFSYLGMEPQTIPVASKKELIVTLKAKVDELEEVTVVAFAKQKKESVIASVSTVKPSDLKVPSSNLTNAFSGRIAGMISYQRTGEPGEDNSDFFIRGVTTFGTGKSNPLILIDGVEMTTEDLARLTTDDIASFSIMKDANATALYGARGANGVILVSTKEGKEGKVSISVRAEGSFSSPTEQVGIADPVTYMRMHNEAVRTRDPLAALPYSTSKIVNTEKGLNPLQYPAIDWRDMLFNNHTFNQRYNMSISGGGKIARYYVAAAYNKDNGIIQMDKRNNFNNNISINKYILRSNINIDLTKSTEIIVRLHGAFDDYSGPLDGGSSLYEKALNASPVLFQPYYPADEANKYTSHILFGNYGEGNYSNPYADMVKGYQEYSRSTMLAQFEAKQKLDFITEGLSARALFNVNRYSKLGNSNSYKPFYYSYSANPDSPDLYKLTALNPDGGTEYLEFATGAREVTSTLYFEGALAYQREFNDKHNVSGMLVYTMRDYVDSNAETLQLALPHRNIGLAGRFTYGYDSRYFVEGNFGYNGSERFAKNERFGFFPSIGLGWIVSNESFMKPYSKWLSKLKLKATYGLVGNDQIGENKDRFFYLSQVNANDSGKGFTFGEYFNYTRNGVSISRYEDPFITWEIGKKMNLGLELNLWNSLELQVDYFTEHRSNILQERSYIPTTMGLQATPQANVGKAKGGGIDISLDYNHSFSKDLWVSMRGNFTYASSEYVEYEEPDYSDTPWLSRKGKKISQTWGLVAERLFLDEEEVKNSPKQTFGDYGAGDIKYKDINGDQIIDDRDKVPIGFPKTPEINYGFGLSAGYKGIDFSCFFQGSARSSFWIDPAKTAPFVGNTAPRALLQYYADDHWSEDNKNIYALWPRLSASQVKNNEQASTWFMRDGAFIRLKTVEVGYSLPQKWVKTISLANVRLYVTGNNLCVWSKFKMWDPELAGNAFNYPLQRVFNFGVNINL